MRSALLLVLLLASLSASAEPQTYRFYGYAYDLKSGQYLYTEVHEQTIDGERWLGGRIRYFSPQAQPIADKTLDFSRDPYIPLYRLKLQSGYEEAISDVSAREVVAQKREQAGAKLQDGRITRAAPDCADSGFHPFVRDHFAELLSGKTLSFNFIVAGNLDRYRFRASRLADAQFDGRKVVRFRVEPDSMLRYFVDALEVSYEPQTRQLLEYRGISNLHDPATGKPYVARIAYTSKPPADVPKLPPLTP